MKSGFSPPTSSLHVAIIMDGNGRWARKRGLPRIAGHREGANAVRRVVEKAPELDIATLTLYAFSSDNWQRPRAEVVALMELLERYLREEWKQCVEKGVRINVIGRRDRLPAGVIAALRTAEIGTASADRLNLRLAVDYSSRHAIRTAALSLDPGGRASEESFSLLVNRAVNSSPQAPDVDLLIRTSGEQRLSDFLLWESAYAELVFTERLWPDFGGEDLARAVSEFRGRDRRFGRIPEAS
jgi:undecaprenyl diphosphate synthase